MFDDREVTQLIAARLASLEQKLRARNPHAKLICIDLKPNLDKQAIDRADILNVGGFSDTVFDVITSFVKEGHDAQHWVKLIDQIEV